MAETIENNVRRLIIDEMAVNPKYYEKMSELLDALILQRKQEAIEYKAYLAEITKLARWVSRPDAQSSYYPSSINSSTLRALYDNLGDRPMSVREQSAHSETPPALNDRESDALALDVAIREVKKADWRGNRFKEREVRNAIESVIGNDSILTEIIFEIVKNQRDY